MGKIICQCGYVLLDSTDFIPYKARYFADQDLEDFFDEVESECLSNKPRQAMRYLGHIFQCVDCGNLIVFTPGGNTRRDFRPLDGESGTRVTLSSQGDQWKGILRAHFYDSHLPSPQKSSLFWYTNREQGFVEDLGEEELRTRYFEKMKELQAIGVLRDCFLCINGEIVHQWPEKR